MGLDLMPVSLPRQGFETEFLRIIDKQRKEIDLTPTEVSSFQQNTIPPFETLGAPRVGHDRAADEWIINKHRSRSSAEEILKEYRGYHVLDLLEDCKGIPEFSNGCLYDGVDRTSFRGEFLRGCKNLLSAKMLDEAWQKIKTPVEAQDYGARLLESARGEVKILRPTLWNRLLSRNQETIENSEQVKILEAAGNWYSFWGQRGHHIEAYF